MRRTQVSTAPLAETTAATAPETPDVPPPPPGLKSGLEGHVAFRTEIAEPDKDGGALRYRGVDIEDLGGKVSFGNGWALLGLGRGGSASGRWGRGGGAAGGGRGGRRPSRSRSRCTPATCGSTCRPRWRC